MLEKREFEKSDFMWRLSTTVTIVSGLFSLVVFILLLVNYLQIQSLDPINDLLITELREEYASALEKDEALAQRIRDLDLMTRKAFFTSQFHLRVGGMLLLGGVVVFLVAFKNTARWRPDVPDLPEEPPAEAEFVSYARGRQVLTWLGVILLATGLLAAYVTESVLTTDSAKVGEQGLPETAAEESATPSETPVVAKSYPEWEETEKQWQAFRGPGGAGIAHFTTAPMEWDVEADTGVRWKVAVPRLGANSPVVWGNRLFLSGADEEVREVYCFDTETGALVWTKALGAFPGTPKEAPDVSEDTGYAASTMAAHGDQVFAIFANGDIVSYDFDGNQVWGRSLGLPDNHYGHSSSLLAYEHLVYVQLDDNSTPRLLALDAATGNPVWTVEREAISWASPMLARTKLGEQVVLTSEEHVDAYSPLTGALIWSEQCLGGEVAPSAAYSNGIVFAANEYAIASAIQLGGTAEAVESELLWQYDEILPEVASPIGDGERFYFATSMGDLVSLDAQTGTVVWEEMHGDGFYSSPVLVGDRIYVLDMEGIMYIFRASATFELIASNPTGEPTFATPAFMDGRIYIRGVEYLYCIENQDG
jgi:outer membrane protein assembly factor BamB